MDTKALNFYKANGVSKAAILLDAVEWDIDGDPQEEARSVWDYADGALTLDDGTRIAVTVDDIEAEIRAIQAERS